MDLNIILFWWAWDCTDALLRSLWETAFSKHSQLDSPAARISYCNVFCCLLISQKYLAQLKQVKNETPSHINFCFMFQHRAFPFLATLGPMRLREMPFNGLISCHAWGTSPLLGLIKRWREIARQKLKIQRICNGRLWRKGVRMSGSLISFLVLSIALDFLAELCYKGPFCICLYNSTRMRKGRDFILSRENSKCPFPLHTGSQWTYLSAFH